MARPHKPDYRRKTCSIAMRLTPNENDKIERAAAQVGMTVSEWSRYILEAAATELLKRKTIAAIAKENPLRKSAKESD